MQRFLIAIFCIGFLLTMSPMAFAHGLNTMVRNQAQSVNTRVLDQEVSQLVGQHSGIRIPSVTAITRALLHHKNPMSLSAILRGLEGAVAGDVAVESRVLGIIFVLSVLAAVLGRLTDSLGQGGVAEVSRLAVLSALILVALHSFAVAIAMVTGLIGELWHLMEAIIPLLVVLMAGTGAFASAGIFHPLMLFTVNLVALLTRDWVLPLILFATIVELVGHWLPKFSLHHLGQLMRVTGLTLLGGLMTLFLGVMAVEGAAGSVADGVTLRTGKFLANTFVPVVGKMFSDAMEAVLGSSLLLKNAVSMVGALAIIVMVAFPLLKLFLMMVLYRLGAAATEPLNVPGVSPTLGTMANALGWLMAISGAVALMFFLVVTVVASASNGVVL